MFWGAIIVFVGIPAIALIAGAVYDYYVMTKQHNNPAILLTKRYQSKKINSVFNSSLPEPSNIWFRRNKDQHYWN